MVTSAARVAGASGSKPSPVVRGEELAMTSEPGRAWRNRVQHLFGHGEFGGFQGRGQRLQRLPLIGGGLPLYRRAAVAAHGVNEVLAADHGRGGFHGVAVIHEDRHQRLFDGRHGRAVADGMLAQAAERGAAQLHQAVQFVGLVDAVRPLFDARVDAGVLIGEVAQVLLPGVVQDAVQLGLFVTFGQRLDSRS